MLNWLVSVITFKMVISCVVGLLAGYYISWCVAYRKWKRTGEPMAKRDGFTTIVGVIIVIAMVWIMVATQQARNCAITLNSSLSVEIAAGKMEREAFQNAIAQQQTLPKEIQDLPQNSPEKKAAMKPIEDQYFSEVAKAKKLREDNAGAQDAARRACGTT